MASKLNINYLNLEFSRFKGFLLMEVLLFIRDARYIYIGPIYIVHPYFLMKSMFSLVCFCQIQAAA